MFNKFLSNLQQLNPTTLSELDSVSLQNRIDSKYILNEKEMVNLLPCLIENYKILTIKDERIFSYENNYFDTSDYLFFKDHHNGYANRIKVRSRRYVESDLCFFEIKKKEKVNRTNKHRESLVSLVSDINEEKRELIQSFTRKELIDLQLILKNNFKRITLVNNEFTERVTIDFKIHFADDTNEVNFEGITVVEIKQSKSSQASPLVSFLKESNTREQSFSKYIFGVISLKPEIKKNNFLPILKNINKIKN
ncbi:polyphosphate polymerase domain-containing protein [Flavobacterium sp.]|uniref:polyphosphate polymerase domain-containing protein n=1 Tax=Flavobacterium sp. TaxID=239 RepID=UPI0025C116F3|nr:polyphosphate polymerase domain-containing protein [Flavobacterium sp.]MBA4154690.1 hypothetical protein [Flavobacterium sp.]